MAKLYVHICDRCTVREETRSSTVPNDWVELTYTQHPYGEEQSLLWCGYCWTRANKLERPPVQAPKSILDVFVDKKPDPDPDDKPPSADEDIPF